MRGPAVLLLPLLLISAGCQAPRGNPFLTGYAAGQANSPYFQQRTSRPSTQAATLDIVADRWSGNTTSTSTASISETSISGTSMSGTSMSGTSMSQTSRPSPMGGVTDDQRVVRAQSPSGSLIDRYAPGSDEYSRYPMAASGIADPQVRPVQYQTPGGFAPPPAPVPSGGAGIVPVPGLPPLDQTLFPEANPPQVGIPVPWDVYVTEARTGQFILGVGINSDAGVTGQIILDERNFDIARWPTSWDDIANGTALRGAGQGFRVEAIPGRQVERYTINFVEPYLTSQISLSVSGFLFGRRYFDWDEERLGGRVALGYRLSPDLSLSAALRMEEVKVFNPRVLGVPELDAALGDSALFSPRFTLTHDTRDIPFAPTEGHYIELSYEQVFGDFDYPRGEFDFRKYFLIRERPDGSGRHTLAYNFRLGISGSETPIFENYFAGGYSTLRGFDYRGASPKVGSVTVGGEFRFLGSVEYFFPITADDMIKGVVFCDFGTVEESIAIHADDYRVAPGFGLRISVPALGPAPIAVDLAVPVAREDTDDIQNFSFFFGFGRG
jgi:outer membrane protein insertion porin family